MLKTNEIIRLVKDYFAEKDYLEKYDKARINFYDSSHLLGLSRNLAVDGVRYTDQKLLKIALLLLIIENAELDARDNLQILTLVYHSYKEIGLNPDCYFMEISRMYTLKMSELITSFIRRPEKNKSLESAGYKIVTNPIFDYVSTESYINAKNYRYFKD